MARPGCGISHGKQRRDVLSSVALAALLLLPILGACGRRATRPAKPSSAEVVQGTPEPQPTPPPLPGLEISLHPEPVFGGQYALLSVGPLRAAVADGSGAAGSSEGVIPAPSTAAPPTHDASPQTPPLLLVHGLGRFGKADYYPLLESLAADRQVLVVDLPGFAQSSRGNFAYRPEDYARFLAHVVDTHARGNCDVVGHSMGGAISIALAAEYPSRVRRLALLDAAGILYREALVYEMQNEFVDAPERNPLNLATRDLWSAALSFVSPLSVDPDTILNSAMLRRKVLGGDSLQIAALALLEHNFDPDLHAVKAPTLLLWGREDSTAPVRTFHVLRERLPIAKSVLWAGVEHNPMATAPERVLEELVPFLSAPNVPAVENTRPGPGAAKSGACNGEPTQTFEGRWATLDIRNCRQVLIQNAVVDELIVSSSTVELRHVTVEHGTQVIEGRLRATGSLLLGDNALVLRQANVDLAGVEVVGNTLSLWVTGDSNVLASVSGAATYGARNPLHGRHRLAAGTTW